MNHLCIIAESNSFIANLLQRFAEKQGLESTIVQVGQDVLTQARRENPALIVIDPELPGKVRGWDVIRQLRADPATTHIPMIACAWADTDASHKAVGQVDGVLSKPEIHYEDFTRALQQTGVCTTSNEIKESNA